MNHEDLNTSTPNNWGTAKTLRDIAKAYSAVYEGKGDGNLANNYPPYDKVTRGDVIAGALGKDQEGGKKKKKVKEEVEQVDEGIGSAIRGLFSKKKEDEAPKPESRGEQLRKRYNVGPEKSYTSAKRQILNRAQGNAERAQTQVDMGNASQSYADKAKEAHNSYLKAGYSKYGADLPYAGRGNKARKRAAAMTPREIGEAYAAYEFVASYLLENNFASTVDDANVIINNMSEGWFDQIMEG